MRPRVRHLPPLAIVLMVAALALALSPAIADPVPGKQEFARVAFLARNDVPFDAQTAAAVAAQLGAPIFITSPTSLSEPARAGIADANPRVIIVAGGPAAVSDAVAAAAAAACDPDCTIDRRFGPGRDATARALAGVAADYNFDRPVLQGSGQVVGEVNIGGTLNVDALTVQQDALVPNLNADLLDGFDAAQFRFINVQLYGVNVGGGAELRTGSFGNAGIALPDAGTPRFDVGFTVPPDYTPGDAFTIHLTWYSTATSCGFDLRPNFTSFARVGRTFPGGAASAGLTAVGGTVLNAPATAEEVSTKRFVLTSPDAQQLQPFDSVVFGLFRSSGAGQDTCTQPLLIHSVALTY